MSSKFRELLLRLDKCGVWSFFLIKELDWRVVAVELLHLTCSSVRKVSVEGIEQALLSKKPS